jgi:hypothetical protein
MNETKRGPGRPRNDETDNNDDAESMFRNIPHNYTVKVYRLEPEYCDGYVGQYNMGANRELSLEEIKNRFGGSKFELVVYNPGKGGILKRRQIQIDDFPKREGKIINRDGTTQDVNTAGSPMSSHPMEKIMTLGLPPHLQRQVAAFYLGTPEQSPEMQPQSHNNATADLMMQKMIMEMMTQSSRAQMEMMQQQMEMRQSMLKFQRDMEESAKPKNPLGDMDNMIKVIRELNGFKNELGGNENQSVAAQLVESMVPLVEGGLTEFFSFKKIQAQADLARNSRIQSDRPELPARQIRSATPSLPVVSDPIAQAKQMGLLYRNMSEQEQNAIMQAFLQSVEDNGGIPVDTTINDDLEPDQNIEMSLESDKMELESVLSDEDRAILHGKQNHIEAGNISNREHAGTAKTDYPTDRAGDTQGIPVSAH